jgi:hypothetical protein
MVADAEMREAEERADRGMLGGTRTVQVGV